MLLGTPPTGHDSTHRPAADDPARVRGGARQSRASPRTNPTMDDVPAACGEGPGHVLAQDFVERPRGRMAPGRGRRTMLLAGDIGGTKTALGVFSPEGGARAPLGRGDVSERRMTAAWRRSSRRFSHSTRIPSTAPALVSRGRSSTGPRRLRICRGRSTRRVSGSCSLSTECGSSTISSRSRAPCPPWTRSTSTRSTPAGRSRKARSRSSPRAPAWARRFSRIDEGRYRAHPSEGGHGDFAPRGAVQEGLLESLRAGRIARQLRACVSPALGSRTYTRTSKRPGPRRSPRGSPSSSPGRPIRRPAIIRAATDHAPPAELAVAALELFVSILAAEAGNLALKELRRAASTSAASSSPRILPALDRGEFMAGVPATRAACPPSWCRSRCTSSHAPTSRSRELPGWAWNCDARPLRGSRGRRARGQISVEHPRAAPSTGGESDQIPSAWTCGKFVRRSTGSAATCSAAAPTKRPRRPSSITRSTTASTSSTPPTSIRSRSRS